MSYLTKLDGVPDSDQAKPGMAFFAGTGPAGKTCGDCKLRGYSRQSSRPSWNAKAMDYVHRAYRTTACQMFKKLTGIHGPTVKTDWPSCKYFEAKEKVKEPA
jgi:hypothetical protein